MIYRKDVRLPFLPLTMTMPSSPCHVSGDTFHMESVLSPLHLLYQMYIVTIGLIKMAEFLVVEDILLFSVCNTKKKYKTTFFPQKSITFAYVVGHKPGHTASIYRL